MFSKTLRSLALLFMIPSLNAQAADKVEISDLQKRVVDEVRDARKYIPFQLDEICKVADGKSCKEKYRADEWIAYKRTIEREGKKLDQILFQGTASQYVDFLNEKEQELTRKGFSLRDDAVEIVTSQLPTDILQLREQLLAELRVKAGDVIGSLVRDPIPESQCPTLPDLDLKVFGGQPLNVGTARPLPVDQIVGKMNETQRVLCALGYNMLDGMDLSFIPDPRSFLNEVMQKRDKVLNDLGLPKYLSIFQYTEFRKLQEIGDIAKDIERRIQNKQLPSPEELQAALDKLDIRLPEIDRIPNIPNIPAPTAPKRMDLKQKKRKDWPGFSFGDKSVIAAESNAYLEINGTDRKQEMVAEGKASGYVFSHEINILGGYGYAYVGPDKVSIKLKLAALGKDIFPPLDESASVKWVKENPKAFNWHFEEGYSQTFMIGPIPVAVAAGVFADLGIGYRVGLETTQLTAQIRPFANAGGYARAGVGIAGLLSAGAGAELVVLGLNVPLGADLGLRFDEVGYPFLGLDINADLTLEYLNGRIYAYVEFPIPAFALPPWEIKKETLTLFKFPGQRLSHKIMNWGMEISRFGVKTRGDLVDQSDREEAAALNQAVLADVRNLELGKYEQKVFDRSRAVFEGVLTDLKSENNLRSYERLEKLKIIDQNLTTFMDTFQDLSQ
jgi:hypothetical protein